MGAEQSFEEFVRARTAALSRVAYLLTGDHHLAEDLVQQALLRVAGRWPTLVARGDPDAYVRRVMYNQRISWWRRREPPTVRHEVPQEAAPDPGDAVVAAVAVRQALARLGPRQRAVLILRYFEDLTEARTAEILGISVGTVKSQARDGLARLRALAPELSTLAEVDR
ncbi:SigE family RNA polymerase sigma factor [Rugosimonospora africana]|uniref:SigE family RNA polymerase sigma factor n=1 Tax=Rugosimonospora africana TaxID=556532 RepID=UPI0019448F61|nr:SigE family RNA polymerase sigma factor [Rugosimonospora africana]